ncbi:MAG: sodium:alanine symporter family protein [Lachnospiraceae bacterium]|nr:sodium:alanine symporter family protein [Lachnospiraceae bacterium]
MERLFETINHFFRFVTPVSDFFWDFPTNFEWYASIPVLGNFSLAILLLVGSGIFFTLKTGFIQVTHFSKGIKLLTNRKKAETGISPLAAFFLSSAMRVGPGNILGVTGAIAIGGPGALFWMWMSAFFGMATAYVEAVLAQIFKEKKADEFVGGLPFYGKRLLGNKAWAGISLSIMYLIYAMCCLPAQGFNVVSSMGQIAEIVTGSSISTTSVFYYVLAALLIMLTAIVVFSGIKKITKVTDKLVPVMAVIYVLTVLLLITLNLDKLPYFFRAVFGGAFTTEAVFGGTFGTVLAQGVKRGLMSNEAGQGTITMAAGAASCEHPCEQGIVQSIGVFLDTMVICTLTGFVVVMAQLWNGTNTTNWFAMDRLPKFLTSAAELTPGTALNAAIMLLLTLCFCLFAYTTLIGMISFSEIAANCISRKKSFLNGVRITGLAITDFGILCSMAGLDLGNLWAISDLGNILIVFANVPLLYLGAKYVFKATAHFKKKDGTPFDSEVVGTECEYWDSRES